MHVPIIIGSGLSGLSAANYLLDNGVKPIIIEADIIGRIKVCGEFFSHESIPFLRKWDIPFLEIKKANFITINNNYSLNFPVTSASASRSITESLLAQRAIKLGAQIYEKTFVQEIIPAKTNNDKHYVTLSSGQILVADKLIITTSKLPFLNSVKTFVPNYIGIKAHFTNIVMPNELNMYMLPRAYMGVTYINASTVNICCLAKKNLVDKFGSVDLFMQHFFAGFDDLKKISKTGIRVNTSWLTTPIGSFGKKSVPDWPNSYCIGDAIASICPAAGNGLAMGLTAGVMAAQHIIFNKQTDFKNEWNLRYSKRLKYAEFLHSLFISPFKANIAFKFVNLFPFTSNVMYKLTRDNY